VNNVDQIKAIINKLNSRKIKINGKEVPCIFKINNKLETNLRCVLMNFWYAEGIPAEIQIVIDDKSNIENKHKEAFHHKVYEICRDVAGPYCAAWEMLDSMR
jgi:hypothetical protein